MRPEVVVPFPSFPLASPLPFLRPTLSPPLPNPCRRQQFQPCPPSVFSVFPLRFSPSFFVSFAFRLYSAALRLFLRRNRSAQPSSLRSSRRRTRLPTLLSRGARVALVLLVAVALKSLACISDDSALVSDTASALLQRRLTLSPPFQPPRPLPRPPQHLLTLASSLQCGCFRNEVRGIDTL